MVGHICKQIVDKKSKLAQEDRHFDKKRRLYCINGHTEEDMGHYQQLQKAHK